jgi:hypothetical protein
MQNISPTTNNERQLVLLKERTMTRKQRRTIWSSALLLSLFALAAYAQELTKPTASSNTKGRIFAQALVENTLSKYPTLAGVGFATTEAQGKDCVTIADTDPKELGDKCDKGELAVMKSGKSTVEKETDGYDVTLPLHVRGKTIGIIAMDFKLDEKEAGLLDRAKVIAKELEDQIPEKSKLFESAR